MLVLRLMLMFLTIICLMDGHAEVSSSTTGIRNGTESPVVKPNEPEVQILDRKKKKKPKKPKKPSKKKKPKPKKPKPAKPVTTTPTMTTSTLKTTTILTTPTMETTATTTDSPTTTATTFKTTTSTTSVTTTSTATTTEATSSTASITIATTTIPTTTTTTTAATTADSGAEGECKATNGKPCIFPFKDGNEEYNECKNHGGTYFWCATSVYESGKYKHWSYCPKDGPCPLEGDGECRAKNNKPCVFPFKDGKKEYNECADHGGQYFWCATGTNSAGKYTAWSECPKDGSCPLPQKSTTPAMTSTATAASTTPLITGTTVAIDQMEEKVLGTLENLVLGESRDDSLQMAHMLEKKLDTIIKDLEGETSKSELSNFNDIPPQSGKLNLTLKHDQDDKIRDGTQLGKGLMFVLSTVDSMKSVSRVSGDCCLDCKTKYPDTELAEYWETLDTCYCYKKFKNPDVEPKTRASSKFTTKACAADPTIEDKCCETLTLSASGGAAQYQGHRLGTYKMDGEHNNKAVYKQQHGTNVLHYFRESSQFRWTFASSLSSGGGLSSKLGDASVCPSNVKEWQYYWPGTNNLWLVDSTVAVDCEEGTSLCGIESKIDTTRFLAELNTAYIFNVIDKTKDPTPEYRTQVFDVVTFAKDSKPRKVFNDFSSIEDGEAELITLFLTEKGQECNRLTFDDAYENKSKYYPVFISSSGDISGPIDKFIANVKSLTSFFNGEFPKLCGTRLKMENETAILREKEMKFIFNFFYNNYPRTFYVSQEKTCQHVAETINSIKKSDIFDTSATVQFKEESLLVYEEDKIATVVVTRSSPLNSKAIGFIEIGGSTMEDIYISATADDFVPENNTIVFNENEDEAIVIIRVKMDRVTEDDECVSVKIKEQNDKRMRRNFFTVIRDTLTSTLPVPFAVAVVQVRSNRQFNIYEQERILSERLLYSSIRHRQIQDLENPMHGVVWSKNVLPEKNLSDDESSDDEDDDGFIFFSDIIEEWANEKRYGTLNMPTTYFDLGENERFSRVTDFILYLQANYNQNYFEKDFLFLLKDDCLYQIGMNKKRHKQANGRYQCIGFFYSRMIAMKKGGRFTKEQILEIDEIQEEMRKGCRAQFKCMDYQKTMKEYLKNFEILLNEAENTFPSLTRGPNENIWQFAYKHKDDDKKRKELLQCCIAASDFSLTSIVEVARNQVSFPTILRLIQDMKNFAHDLESDWVTNPAIILDKLPFSHINGWPNRKHEYLSETGMVVYQSGLMPYGYKKDLFLRKLRSKDPSFQYEVQLVEAALPIKHKDPLWSLYLTEEQDKAAKSILEKYKPHLALKPIKYHYPLRKKKSDKPTNDNGSCNED